MISESQKHLENLSKIHQRSTAWQCPRHRPQAGQLGEMPITNTSKESQNAYIPHFLLIWLVAYSEWSTFL